MEEKFGLTLGVGLITFGRQTLFTLISNISTLSDSTKLFKTVQQAKRTTTNQRLKVMVCTEKSYDLFMIF